MSFSIRDVAVSLPLQASILSLVPAAGMASRAPERTAELMQLPVAGMIIGALVIAANGAIGYGIDRAAAKRVPGEVLHP